MSRDAPVVLHTRVVSGTGGGPEKTIFNSARWLNASGYRALCAYMRPPNDPGFESIRQKARAAEAPLVEIEDRGPWDWRVIRRLLAICRQEHVTIWHGHDYKSNLLGLLVRRFWPMRLVTTAHGWVMFEGRAPLYYKIDRFCLRWYESVICVSEDLREACIRSGGRADRCVVIENAIDTAQYTRRQSASEAKRQRGFDPARLLIGAVGRLSPEKNFDGVIRAFGRLLSRGLDAELILIGEGDERASLERLIEQLGLKGRVHLPGHQADLIGFYEAMDLFVLNSLREGLPNVLLEALALEVPVVATRVAGIPRLIEDGRTGLLLEPQDEDALAAAMNQLARDADLRRRLAEAGRRTIEQRYSFAVRMAKVREVYDRLLGETSLAPSAKDPG
jgi:glycosyltransferase involved in cell wall biosynthesis